MENCAFNILSSFQRDCARISAFARAAADALYAETTIERKLANISYRALKAIFHAAHTPPRCYRRCRLSSPGMRAFSRTPSPMPAFPWWQTNILAALCSVYDVKRDAPLYPIPLSLLRLHLSAVNGSTAAAPISEHHAPSTVALTAHVQPPTDIACDSPFMIAACAVYDNPAIAVVAARFRNATISAKQVHASNTFDNIIPLPTATVEPLAHAF